VNIHPLNPTHPYRNGVTAMRHVTNGALGLHQAMSLPQAEHNRDRLNRARHGGLGFAVDEETAISPLVIVAVVGLLFWFTSRNA